MSSTNGVWGHEGDDDELYQVVMEGDDDDEYRWGTGP